MKRVKRRKRVDPDDSTPDMLNNLPDGILENILSSLSARDLVRTSVLSTNWRWKWISVPHIKFLCDGGPFEDEVEDDGFVSDVNHVLLIHRGPIQTFKICPCLTSCPDINNWMISLRLEPLTEFELHIHEKSDSHEVLPCLYSYTKLIRLTLVKCIVGPPPLMFKGFSSLRILCFQAVTLSNETLRSIVSLCPELEQLTLEVSGGPTHIELSNPKLTHLCIGGSFSVVSLNDLKHLVSASFRGTTKADAGQQKITCNFGNSLESLLGIQEMFLSGHFLLSLAVKHSTYDHLKNIKFVLNVKDLKEIVGAMRMVKSSPNLQELRIEFSGQFEHAIFHVTRLQETMKLFDSSFKKLRVVEIYEVAGTYIELLLIKFILDNSPVLEKMKIKLGRMAYREREEQKKELPRLKRASPHLEIEFVKSYFDI